MSVSSVGPLDFQNDTDKAEGGLMMLFFGLVFSVAPLWKFFCPSGKIFYGPGRTP